MIIANYKIQVIENLIIDTEENINEQIEQDTIGKGVNNEIPKMIFIGIMKKAKIFQKIIGGKNAKNGQKSRTIQKNSSKNKKDKYKSDN